MSIPTPPQAGPEKTESSSRAQQREALLQEALAQPGIREVMRVYNDYWQVEQVQRAYREATRPRRPVIIATDHTNFDPNEHRG